MNNKKPRMRSGDIVGLFIVAIIFIVGVVAVCLGALGKLG